MEKTLNKPFFYNLQENLSSKTTPTILSVPGVLVLSHAGRTLALIPKFLQTQFDFYAKILYNKYTVGHASCMCFSYC
jgi:hypothetical protein